MNLFNLFRRERVETVTETKGWTSIPWGNWSNNWFQLGKDAPMGNEALSSSPVMACVSILAQEVARLHVNHKLANDLGSTTNVTSSAAFKVLSDPNQYQTRSDLLLYIMQSELLDGNSYTFAERDRRGAVSSLHPLSPQTVMPHVVSETGEVFYHVSGTYDNGLVDIEPGFYIPARDMMHIRCFTGYSPLIGITPLQACGPSVVLGEEIRGQSASFFGNQSRPAGILSTPKPLGKESAIRLRDAWERGLAGKFVGKTAVLDNEIKWQPLALSAEDSQVVEQYKMSRDDIAMVYRVPPYMLGNLEGTSFNNVGNMQKMFIASALGFWLEHIENAMNKLFGFDGVTNYMEFDIERGLMRPDMETRMGALAKGVQGGIYAPNEARQKENLGPVEGGDEAFMQRQMTPVSLLTEIAAADATNGEPAQDPAENMRQLRLVVNEKIDRKLAS